MERKRLARMGALEARIVMLEQESVAMKARMAAVEKEQARLMSVLWGLDMKAIVAAELADPPDTELM